jgi:hypothetical protein
MLSAAARNCPKGYIFSADFDDCIEDSKWLDPKQTTVVKVDAKRDKPKTDWDWRGFWGGIALPGVISQTPPRVIAEPQSNFPPPAPVPFWKTTGGIILIAGAVGAIIVLSRRKK